MCSFQKHDTQAKHNYQLLQDINCGSISRDYYDWKITILFYAALHEVNEAFSKNNCHPGSHKVTNRIISQEAAYKPIKKHYIHLYELCWRARYKCKTMTLDDYLSANTDYQKILTDMP